MNSLYSKFNHAKVLLLAIVIILVFAPMKSTTLQVYAGVNPLLWINPESAQTGLGTEVDLQLDNIVDVYGLQVEMTFDPSILEVVDADPGTQGTQITPGACPAPNFVVTNDTDNSSGQINYAVTQLNPTAPCDGGTVATVQFTCLAEGTSAVAITTSVVSDSNGSSLAHDTQNGTIECIPNVFTIQGTVGLQGWSNPSGTLVQLINEQTGTVENSVQIDASGNFSFAASIDNTYTIVASYDRYLDAEAVNLSGITEEIVDLGASTLAAGDLNDDGIINILDITIAAGNYGKSSPGDW